MLAVWPEEKPPAVNLDAGLAQAMLNRTNTYLGQIMSAGQDKLIGISEADRRQHVHVIGKTGTGKSTLLRNMLIQDIAAGRGVGLIDPHGDLAEEILDHIPSWRTRDVVFFNAADTEYPIGLNLLEPVAPEHRHLVVGGVVEAFRRIWPDSWGPQTHYIFTNAVSALMECQNVSLLGVWRMLVDAQYRAWVVRQVKDPLLRWYWVEEFGRYNEQFARQAVAPILNKVGAAVMPPVLRNILGQVRSGFSPRFMMDHQRILIASLSKGLIGESESRLLGALLVTQFQLAAMQRASLPERERSDFFLYVDEFSSFTTQSFASILSEARKYGLCLVASQQHGGQQIESVRDAVYGNVGTHVAFRVGYKDALGLANEFGNRFSPAEFGEMENHRALVKRLGGVPPIEVQTLEPMETEWGRRELLVRLSRERYGQARDNVDLQLLRWMERQ